MAWLILFISGLLEVVWASAMKASDGFSKPMPSVITGVAAFIGFWLLAMAMRSLPLGTAYPVWVGTFTVGTLWMGEPLTPLRLISVVLIVAGIVGLKISTTGAGV
jgi:quaternary ammonium compound-resistance protein SugE